MGTIYLSLSACGGISTRQALAYISAAGIKHVELAIGVKPDRDSATAIGVSHNSVSAQPGGRIGSALSVTSE